MSKKKVVITGGTGLLGGTSALTMKESWDLTLWTRGHQAVFKDIPSQTVCLTDAHEIAKALEMSSPDVLIHAAGMTSVEECENHQYKAYISNVLTTKILAQECKKRGVKFVYISTDHLAADKNLSNEEEVALPVNVYAKTKLEGEFEALRADPEALVLRTNFFTWGNNYRKSFLDHIVDNCRSKNEITLFDDVKFNPLTAEVLLKVITKLMEVNAAGVFNVTGNENLTKYEFGLMVADVFGLDKKFIKQGKLQNKTHLVKRPFNLSLSNQKLKKAISDFKIQDIRTLLNGLKGQETEFKKQLELSIKNYPNKNFINYGKHFIDEVDFESVMTCLESNFLTQGPRVEEFERAIAKYVGAKYAVAMANWTCGLHMAVLAAGVGPGDYVITSPLSFVASSNCAVYVGAIPYFVDIDPKTLNLDPVKLREACQKLGKKVKAIIPVHFAGAPCEMKEISLIAKEYGAILIEDAAHALGGTYLTGEKVGSCLYSDMVGFSFHPVKNITTGEGGMITTNNKDIYHHLLRLRSHGITKDNESFIHPEFAMTKGLKNNWYYEMQEIGFNFRITDLQCSLGLSQLRKIENFVTSRQAVAKKYDEEFANFKNMKVTQPQLRKHSGNHLYIVRVDFDKLNMTRAELYARFFERGINLHLHYIPIYRQPFYEKNYPVTHVDFKNAEEYYKEAVTFPIYSSLSIDEANKIIMIAKELIG